MYMISFYLKITTLSKEHQLRFILLAVYKVTEEFLFAHVNVYYHKNKRTRNQGSVIPNFVYGLY